MMSAKIATPGLLKITVFWKKCYDVIIPVGDVTNKILSRDSNYIADVFMWPKFGDSSKHKPQFYKDLTRKTAFFERWSWFKFRDLWLALGTILEFYTSVAKGLKLKVRKFFRANSYVCRSYRGKLVVRGGLFAPHPK